MLLYYYLCDCSDGATINVDANKISDYRTVLQQLRSLWPQYDIDGVHNMWIVKPGDKSKGVGECSSSSSSGSGSGSSSPLLAGYLHRIRRRDSATCPH